MNKAMKSSAAIAGMTLAVGGVLAVTAPSAMAMTEVTSTKASCPTTSSIEIKTPTSTLCVNKDKGAVSKNGIKMINNANPTEVTVKTTERVTFSTDKDCPKGTAFRLNGAKFVAIQIGN